MNDRQLRQLFDMARRDAPPAVPSGLAGQVMRALRQESSQGNSSLSEQLVLLWPRLAWAAALVILLSVGGDYSLAWLEVPSLTDGAAQLSEQWLFAVN